MLVFSCYLAMTCKELEVGYPLMTREHILRRACFRLESYTVTKPGGERLQALMPGDA